MPLQSRPVDSTPAHRASTSPPFGRLWPAPMLPCSGPFMPPLCDCVASAGNGDDFAGFPWILRGLFQYPHAVSRRFQPLGIAAQLGPLENETRVTKLGGPLILANREKLRRGKCVFHVKRAGLIGVAERKYVHQSAWLRGVSKVRYRLGRPGPRRRKREGGFESMHGVASPKRPGFRKLESLESSDERSRMNPATPSRAIPEIV